MTMLPSFSAFRQFSCWPSPRPLWLIGVLCLWSMAAFGILWSPLGSPAETLTALSGLGCLLVWGGRLRRSAALWLLLAAILVQVLSWCLGYFHHPQWVSYNPQIDRLAKLFIFIAVAWWLGGSVRHVFWVWGLALSGFLIATFTHGDGWQEWWYGLQGVRTGFGIRNDQHGSMLFGVAIMGVVAFAPRWIGVPRLIWWRLLSWLFVFALCITGILIGQTRAVWLALALALPLMGCVWAGFQAHKSGIARLRRPLLIAVSALCIGGAILVSTFYDTLSERIGTESQVIAQVLHGQLDEVPYTSVGIRIHSWVAASEWIAERPWVGWGGQGRSLVIDETPWLPDFVKQQFGHLHNTFIEIWVAYGLLGLAVMAALVAWVGIATWRAWKSGNMPADMALFSIGFFVYWVIVNQFEAYLSFSTGVTVHNLVVGGLVSLYWRHQWSENISTG